MSEGNQGSPDTPPPSGDVPKGSGGEIEGLVGIINEYAEAIRMHERNRLRTSVEGVEAAAWWEGRWKRSAQAIKDILSRITSPSSGGGLASFQVRVDPWLIACFGEEIARDKQERAHRFLEEALELVQAAGCTAHEAHQLVAYVYGRPAGEMAQEGRGVMTTLAAFCLAHGLDMHEAGETELARIWTKVEKIRAKQAAKPKHSPLPEHVDPTPPDLIQAAREAETKIDAQVWTAAAELNAAQRAQPEWVWFDHMAGYGASFGRWSKSPEQAPYVRADIALRALQTTTRREKAAPTPDANSGGEAAGSVPDGWEFSASLSCMADSRWQVTLRRKADGHLVTAGSVASLESAHAGACELAHRAPGLRLAEGCCSAVSPCSHQRRSPYTICDICQKAANLSAAPHPSQEKDGRP